MLKCSPFSDFIRKIIFYITLTNFLCVCQLFDDNKKITINSYAEVLSAVLKSVNHSPEKNGQFINLFRKIDKNDTFKRIVSFILIRTYDNSCFRLERT